MGRGEACGATVVAQHPPMGAVCGQAYAVCAICPPMRAHTHTARHRRLSFSVRAVLCCVHGIQNVCVYVCAAYIVPAAYVLCVDYAYNVRAVVVVCIRIRTCLSIAAPMCVLGVCACVHRFIGST